MRYSQVILPGRARNMGEVIVFPGSHEAGDKEVRKAHERRETLFADTLTDFEILERFRDAIHHTRTIPLDVYEILTRLGLMVSIDDAMPIHGKIRKDLDPRDGARLREIVELLGDATSELDHLNNGEDATKHLVLTAVGLRNTSEEEVLESDIYRASVLLLEKIGPEFQPTYELLQIMIGLHASNIEL